MIVILKDNEWFDRIHVNQLESHQSMGTDEWETNCDIGFLFRPDKIQEIKIFDDTLKVIGVQMYILWDEEVSLRYILKDPSNEDTIVYFGGVKIPNQIIEHIYYLLAEEETKTFRGEKGWLKRFNFTEDPIFEDNLDLVCCEDCVHNCEDCKCSCKDSKFYGKKLDYAVVCNRYFVQTD